MDYAGNSTLRRSITFGQIINVDYDCCSRDELLRRKLTHSNDLA